MLTLLLVPLLQVSASAETRFLLPLDEPQKKRPVTYEELARRIEAEDDFEMAVVARAAVRGLGDWRYTTTLGGQLFGPADLNDGDVTLSRIGVRVHHSTPLTLRDELALEWGFEQSGHDFSDSARVSSFNEVWRFSLSSTLDHDFHEAMRGSLHASVAAGAEEGADWGEALSFGGGATLSFPLLWGLELTAGGFGSSRLEDSPLFYPWAQIDWQATDKLSFGQQGSGYGLGYDWFQDLSSYLSLSFMERQYRMDRFSVDGVSYNDGAARDSEFALNAGAILQWNSRLKLEVFAGLAVRTLTLLDRDDDEVFDETTGPAGYFGLALRYGFGRD